MQPRHTQTPSSKALRRKLTGRREQHLVPEYFAANELLHGIILWSAVWFGNAAFRQRMVQERLMLMMGCREGVGDGAGRDGPTLHSG